MVPEKSNNKVCDLPDYYVFYITLFEDKRISLDIERFKSVKGYNTPGI